MEDVKYIEFVIWILFSIGSDKLSSVTIFFKFSTTSHDSP